MNLNCLKVTSSFLVLVLSFTYISAAPGSNFEESEVQGFQKVNGEDPNRVLTFKFDEMMSKEDFPYDFIFSVNDKDCVTHEGVIYCEVPDTSNTKDAQNSVNIVATFTPRDPTGGDTTLRTASCTMVSTNGGFYSGTASGAGSTKLRVQLNGTAVGPWVPGTIGGGNVTVTTFQQNGTFDVESTTFNVTALDGSFAT